MSDPESMPAPALPPPPDQPAPDQPKPRGPRTLRRVLWTGFAVVLLVAAAVAGFVYWAGSTMSEEWARHRLIATLERSTGGRVEVSSFHWRLFDLEAEAGGVVIHGSESPGQAPWAEIERLRARVSILGLWSPRILLRDLEVVHPGFHLIVYPDGSTNQPHPARPGKPGELALDRLFDLQAGHIAVKQGVLAFEDQAEDFDFLTRYTLLDFDAHDVSLLMSYVPPSSAAQESYRIEAGAADMQLSRGPLSKRNQPVEGYMQATLDLMRNSAYLRSLRISSRQPGEKDRSLEVSGAVTDFAHPHWEATANGEVDMRLIDPSTGFPWSPEGIAQLDLTAEGGKGLFRIDGSVHVDGGAYVGPGVIERGLNLNAHVHADPEQLLITAIAVRLHQGGEIDGAIALTDWLPPIPGATVLQAAGQSSVRATVPLAHAALVRPPPIFIPVNGKVTAELKDVSLDTVLDIVGVPPFQRLGLDARLNGPSTATWSKGNPASTVVSATLALDPTGHPEPGESPTVGAVDATYSQRDGAVDLRKLELHTPASTIEAQGKLGAYPLTSATAMTVDFRSHDLAEFDTVLNKLGLERNGKTGAAALPVRLSGVGEFHGSWAGSLLDPHLTGTATATHAAIEMPPRPGDKTAQPQWIQWDSVAATGSYSASRIAIDRGQLRRGNAQIDLNGSLDASGAAASQPKAPEFDASSVLRVRLHAQRIGVADLMPLTGLNLPVSGTLDAQLEGSGALRALAGSGWVELDNGAILDEPVARVRAQGSMANQVIKLVSITASDAAGKLSASGSYDLKSGHYQLSSQGSGIDVGRLESVRRQGLDLAGKLGFSITGSGTLADPHLDAHAGLSDFIVEGESLGGVELTAHAANHAVTYDATTRLETAELTVHGETALSGSNSTEATLRFTQFNIGALLKMAHVEGLSGESSLAGTLVVSGPLARPEDMRGEARLDDLAVTISGVHLKSQGGLRAELANGRVTLDPLHITGEQTDLRAQGSLSLKGAQQLDMAASGSINLKLAETIDPDLTASGTTTFQVEAHGPLKNPGFQGRVDFENGSLALEDLANGLSQVTGTLEFSQNRLQVKSLTAMTGGGLLSVTGYLAYQHGIYADLTVTGNGIRIRYPQGVSSLADATLRLQGAQNNLLLSGNVMITRFSVSSDLDIAALAAQANTVQTVAPPSAPSNHVHLDVHVVSSPQLNFQNAFAKLAGDVDLRLRGTVASPSLLGRVSLTEGNAIIAGTRYELQRGDIAFTNPVRIEPSIDLNATARVSDYDITLGLHGTPDKMSVTYRSDPPLPEADVVALLALGRTESEQRIYTEQQEQTGANPATDALLGGALNATVSSRVQKLFGAGSVKVDPNYLGALGNSTSRIIVEEQLGRDLTLTYATNVNTTQQQLLQAEIAINRHVSLLVARDESGVFSMVVKATRRYR